jgi:ABC-2 type transport system permease protein
VEDILREYAVAGKGHVTAEVVDPAHDPVLEAEANQSYGILPTPFQVADRYQASVINAYFDILVRYGDQDVVLNFRDLIQVEQAAGQNSGGGVDVRLRNLEYDLTSAIKKVLYGFQSIETVLAAQAQPLKLTLYATPATLPAELAAAPSTMRQVAEELAQKSGGKLVFEEVDPTAPATDARGASSTVEALAQDYGSQPIPASLSGSDSFYLHMVLQPSGANSSGASASAGSTAQVIYPQNDMSEVAVRGAIEAAALRTSAGFLKVVGLWTAPGLAQPDMFGQTQPPLLSHWQSYNLLRDQLRQEYKVRDVDLADGQPPVGVDVLLLVAPQNMTDQQRFAVDQFLMRGGSVVVLAGHYAVAQDAVDGQLALQPLSGTLGDQLRHYGVDVPQRLVLDRQNQPFPTEVVRSAGGIQVQEIQAVDYPFFVDVRPNGMESQAGITSNLANVVLYWTSPVVITPTLAPTVTATTLLQSSPNAWLRSGANIQPDYQRYPESGFGVEGELGVQPLAASLQGPFSSYFAGKPNPLAQAPITATGPTAPSAPVVAPLLQAADSARLVVVGSNEFVDDAVLQLASSLVGDQVLNNVQFVQNAIDWAVEDTDLLSLRSRGLATRLLEPLGETQQQFWELLTYFMVLGGLAAVGAAAHTRRRRERPMQLSERDAFVKASIIG